MPENDQLLPQPAGSTSHDGDTREELIAPNVRMGALQDAIAAALAGNDLKVYAQATKELALAYAERGFVALDQGQLGDCARDLGQAASLARQTADWLDQARQNVDADPDCASEVIEKRTSAALLEGLAHLMEWMINLLSGRPRASSAALAKSHDAFAVATQYDDARVIGQTFQQLVSSLEYLMSAREAMRRLEFSASVALSQRAHMTLERQLREIADQEDDDGPIFAIRQLLKATEIVFERVAYKSRAASGDYRTALFHADRACEQLERAYEDLPAFVPSWTRNFGRLEVRQLQAERAQIAASLAQLERRWDDALSSYEQARSHLLAAGRAALDLPIGSALQIQEALLSQAASVETNIQRCLSEHAMWKENALLRGELQSLREAVISGLNGAGVTVTTNAEATSSIEQTTLVIAHLEGAIRGTAQDLAVAVRQAAIDQELKDVLIQAATEISASSERGITFIDRAKRAARNVADAAQRIGEGAAIATVVHLSDALLRMLGLPPQA